MRKAFYISSGIFGVSLFLLVFYIFTLVQFTPDEIINSPFPGIKELVRFLEVINGVDIVVTFFSGLSTIITGILKRYFD